MLYSWKWIGDVGVDVFLFQMHSLAKKNVKIVG